MFQAKLAALRDSAPQAPFKEMRKVIESDYGERLTDVFAEFRGKPLAAASMARSIARAYTTAGGSR